MIPRSHKKLSPCWIPVSVDSEDSNIGQGHCPLLGWLVDTMDVDHIM